LSLSFSEKNPGNLLFNPKTTIIMAKKYVCDVCGWEYDPEVGAPDQGVAPGTAFEDLPENFECPLCGVGTDEFSPLED
jgi:rubredoxin-NAD+ reductase